MEKAIICLIVIVGVIFALAIAADSETLLVNTLHYIEFDGHQYVTNNGHLSQRVLTHSPKCKCLEINQ